MSNTSTLITGLLAAANHLLDNRQADQAAACLQAALKLQPDCLAAHNLLERMSLPGAMGRSFGINGIIHPEDDIFRFFATHFSSTNPVRDYLADGWRTLAELQSILSRINVRLDRVDSFLEFACGHGRFTRHLVNEIPPHSLTVSDVVPSCVPFLTETFGVKGFLSTLSPEELEPANHYDMVFVLSLFSHLPARLWQKWLTQLFSFVSPGGHLIFTTHGEYSARQLGVAMNDEFVFFTGSESQQIESSAYGSSFTSEKYVKNAIHNLDNGNIQFFYFPAHFWLNQDAWVLKKPERSLS